MNALARTLGRIVKTVTHAAGRVLTPKVKPSKVRGSYDAAQYGTDSDNHWSWADSLNANASNDPQTRKTLRERARYEAANNGYCGGLIKKTGNDLIGTRPRIQLVIPGTDRKASRRIEKAFGKWARKARLGRKLRLLDNMALRDGEGFAILVRNPHMPAGGVQLDLRLYETDQVDTPFLDWSDPLAFPGGRLDPQGNITEWHFLKVHPGSNVWWTDYLNYDTVGSRAVIHWMSPSRAGQLRGVPEILSSLTLYAYLRRYTLATVAAAETASNIAGVMKTNTVAPDGDGPDFTAMEDVPLPRGSLLTLPEGWDASQFKAEQPVTAYGAFKTEILTEAGTSVGAPQNISTGSSALYNYSSGRLDLGIYQRGIDVRRDDVVEPALDQIFAEWLDEASLIPGLIPDGLPLRSEWTWQWYYDGFAAIDPQKEATGNKIRLENGETTLAKICAENGDDWEEILEQSAVEFSRRAELRQVNRPGADPTATAGPKTPGSPAAPVGLSDSQVSTILKILDSVAGKKLNPDAAVSLIRTAFPMIPEDRARAFVGAKEPANAA